MVASLAIEKHPLSKIFKMEEGKLSYKDKGTVVG
jgi:hypothetical protein